MAYFALETTGETVHFPSLISEIPKTGAFIYRPSKNSVEVLSTYIQTQMCRNPCIPAYQSHAILGSSTPFLARCSRVVLILARLFSEDYNRKPLDYSMSCSLARPQIYVVPYIQNFCKVNSRKRSPESIELNSNLLITHTIFGTIGGVRRPTP